MSLKFYKSFSVSFENQTDLGKQLIKNVTQKKQSLIKAFLGSEYDETAIRRAVAELPDVLEEVEPYLAKLVSEDIAHSDTFAYWTEYLEMVKLFLTFVYADQEADWKVHLSSFSEKIRYNRASDHLKYFRWGLVHLVDMSMPETAPDVCNTLADHNQQSVSRSKTVSKFNMVSPEMALEQSQNKDSEVKGGLSEIAESDGLRRLIFWLQWQ